LNEVIPYWKSRVILNSGLQSRISNNAYNLRKIIVNTNHSIKKEKKIVLFLITLSNALRFIIFKKYFGNPVIGFPNPIYFSFTWSSINF